MSLKKDILWRVGVIYLSILVLAAVIFGKIIYLQLFEADVYKQKSQKHTLQKMKVEANRGDILATDGKRVLATSVPHYEIRIDFLSNALSKEVIDNNIDNLAICLSDLFGDKTPLQYKMEIENARRHGNRFYLLKDDVTYDQLKKLETFPIFRRGRYKGGFIPIKKNKRIRPHGILAARTIGYTTKGKGGNIVGVEGAYDQLLKGSKGLRLMRRLSGNLWMPVHDNNEVEPKDGNDVVTTIDVNYQDVAESALFKQLKKQDAQHGTAIVMEVNTGQIKAIANLQRNKEGFYRESYNYGIGESTEPGSTFKLPALMAAIEDGYVDLDDSIDTKKGKVYYYNHPVIDTKEGGYGKISVQRVFEVSSNVGMSKIITKYYNKRESRFIDRLYNMKLNEKLGIEIRGEGKPHIKYPGDRLWSGITLPMMSFGYEVRQTPLQILTFYNAVANGGKMVKPYFVKEIQYHGETIRRLEPEVIDPSIASKSTIEKAHKLLEGVVERGTAENLKNENYKIAGKTGTVELANKEYGYKYKSKTSYQASFVGYFPADKPKYSCIVVINSPSKNIYYGNLVAGPVFKEIADKVYSSSPDLYKTINEDTENHKIDAPYTKPGSSFELYNVLKQLKINMKPNKPNANWVATNKQQDHVDCKPIRIKDRLVPNVKGMGAKDAIYLLESLGMDVEIRGRGKVNEQSVKAGTSISNGARIVLTMSFI
jgi:cell division protein FtsI (penicillin-binding protein 3)